MVGPRIWQFAQCVGNRTSRDDAVREFEDECVFSYLRICRIFPGQLRTDCLSHRRRISRNVEDNGWLQGHPRLMCLLALHQTNNPRMLNELEADGQLNSETAF
jgi:hypothetical protein